MEEIQLTGGNTTDAVVRVGSTGRKPWTPVTPTLGILSLVTDGSLLIGTPQHPAVGSGLCVLTVALFDDVAARGLATFVDGYDASAELRAGLPAAMIERTEAMLDLLKNSHATGFEPWATMYTSGHGDHWSAVARFVREHEAVWVEAS